MPTLEPTSCGVACCRLDLAGGFFLLVGGGADFVLGSPGSSSVTAVVSSSATVGASADFSSISMSIGALAWGFGSGFGTTKTWAHFWHFAFLPAISSARRNRAWQFGQVISIAIAEVSTRVRLTPTVY